MNKELSGEKGKERSLSSLASEVSCRGKDRKARGTEGGIYVEGGSFPL